MKYLLKSSETNCFSWIFILILRRANALFFLFSMKIFLYVINYRFTFMEHIFMFYEYYNV